MNRAESNETIMKQFEIMINTADEALYMEAKAIYLLCIGCARGFLMCSGN